MAWGKRKGTDDALHCSFCQKSQDVVGKLISSPSDYPRAYICDECIAVCHMILEDDKSESPPGTPHDSANQLRRRAHDLVEVVPPEKLNILVESIEDLLGHEAS